MPFTHKAPWTATTPNSRVKTEVGKEETGEKDKDQKVILPTKVEKEEAEGSKKGKQEELDLAEQSAAIQQALGGACTEEMMKALSKLQELQKPKEKISHAHISKSEQLKEKTMQYNEIQQEIQKMATNISKEVPVIDLEVEDLEMDIHWDPMQEEKEEEQEKVEPTPPKRLKKDDKWLNGLRRWRQD